MPKDCMKKTCTATATLTLTNNSGQYWYYCTDHATTVLRADADGNISRTALLVQYVYPTDGVVRADLDTDTLALCR